MSEIAQRVPKWKIAVLEPGRAPGLYVFASEIMKRLSFILSAALTGALGLVKRSHSIDFVMSVGKSRTWAEHVAVTTSQTHARRYEHWIQAKVCNGDYDHLGSAEEAARRRERCAKICGLCRYIQARPVWPDPTYRRPPESVLAALESEAYYRTENLG